jgi:hypothetical protein
MEKIHTALSLSCDVHCFDVVVVVVVPLLLFKKSIFERSAPLCLHPFLNEKRGGRESGFFFPSNHTRDNNKKKEDTEWKSVRSPPKNDPSE